MQQLHMRNSSDYITVPFLKNGRILKDSPVCGLTVKSAGSMRFRWNEDNQLRTEKLRVISAEFGSKQFVPVQLNHTHIVYSVQNVSDTKDRIGDGIITQNKNLIPVVTVADCVPVYLYDCVSGVFGIVHSGWKGTGIVSDALALAQKEYGSHPEDFCISIGPHIHDCCYIVNEERARYFEENFSPDCIKVLEDGVKVSWNTGNGRLFRLSLIKANLESIKKSGVLPENIFIHEDCTCCSKNGFYGSNRRETAENGRPDAFTVQAAFIGWK